MDKEYQEIDIKELVIIVLKKWWLLGGLFIIGVVSAYIITILYVQPIYQSSATLFIGKEQDSIGGIGISVSELQVGSQLINDYKQIIQTRYVIEKVIDELDLDMSVGMFRNSISISTIQDSRLFVVGFRSTNPELARDAANELANQLAIAVSEIVDVENIQIIDKALLPGGPISPNPSRNAMVAGILGIMVGILIILLLEVLNNTFKKEEDIEKELGLPIIGIIPEFKGEKRV